ncbi:hypothetical protein PIROE2DRAFT_19056 [Piromyces sp. E2]|nr:hypothetical protein PIROE2DRAFT_19056 [Piromyces sp. E2]|eukprot:OUM56361.1 hypothetical protein PIROE2DRAFT_19056 [Piromyces sp. E2]
MHNLIAHALIQNNRGEILIVRRTQIKRGKKNYEGGRWDIPGGTVEKMELPSEAAVRETKEEVGLNVKVSSILYEKSNRDMEKQAVFTTLIYKCNIIDEFNIQLDLEEHDTYQWINPEKILSMDDHLLVSYMKELMNYLIYEKNKSK